MSNLSGPCTVYDRTSGDEKDGQDGAAAATQTAKRAEAAGFDLRGVYYDEDLAGDSPWDARKDLLFALGESFQGGWPLVVREVSRLSRFPPHAGMTKLLTVPNLEVLGRPHWSRRGGRWTMDDDTAELMRLIDLWDAWREKRKTRERTQLRMDEFKQGKATKSGKPPGRPTLKLDPAGLERARVMLARGGSQNEAVVAYREGSGYYAMKTPEARAARDVSRRALMRALGQNTDLGKTQEAETGSQLDSKGPLLPQAETGQNTIPVATNATKAAGGASPREAVSDGVSP